MKHHLPMHGMLVGFFQGTDGGIVKQYFVEDAEIVHDKAFRAGKTSAQACENQDSIRYTHSQAREDLNSAW
jgi:hypothetical protein